jgi:hypothetical protein
MKPARSHDDALLERLRAGTGGETEADPRLPLVQALARAASEPPPAAVERRHLAAISKAVVTLGEVGVRSGSNRRPPAAEPGARGLRGLRASRTLKVAALAAATALAIAGLAFASAGLPAPLRTALEEAGLLPEDGADRSRSATRRPAGTVLGRGPRSRCARGGEASSSATPAWCAPPGRRTGGVPGSARRRDRRANRSDRPASREFRSGRRPGGRRAGDGRDDSSRAASERPGSTRGRSGSAPGRSGSSPSRRGGSPVGGARGRSSVGRSGGSGRGRANGAGRRVGRPPARRAPRRAPSSRADGSRSPRR